MSIPDIISAVGSPIAGLFIDTHGHRSTLLPLSGILILINYILLAFTSFTPIFAMSFLGIAYSLFAAALWPCVPSLVGSHQVATAYGIVTVSLNLSLFGFPFLVAKIRAEWPNEFEMALIFFIILSILSILISCFLIYLDSFHGFPLIQPPHLSYHDDTTGIVSADEEETVTTIVVGGGIDVVAPQTWIHHHRRRPSGIITLPRSI